MGNGKLMGSPGIIQALGVRRGTWGAAGCTGVNTIDQRADVPRRMSSDVPNVNVGRGVL